VVQGLSYSLTKILNIKQLPSLTILEVCKGRHGLVYRKMRTPKKGACFAISKLDSDFQTAREVVRIVLINLSISWIMKTCIALFRGINIGGHHIIPMKDLAALLKDLGLHNVKTYIQSGNAVFKSESQTAALLTKKISAAVARRYKFKPHVFVLGLHEFGQVLRSNPFPDAESVPNTLHVYFLESAPDKMTVKALQNVKRDNERIYLGKNVLYLHAPDGVGRSKLAKQAERLLGVQVTARNWRTVCRIMELAEQCSRAKVGRAAVD